MKCGSGAAALTDGFRRPLLPLPAFQLLNFPLLQGHYLPTPCTPLSSRANFLRSVMHMSHGSSHYHDTAPSLYFDRGTVLGWGAAVAEEVDGGQQAECDVGGGGVESIVKLSKRPKLHDSSRPPPPSDLSLAASCLFPSTAQGGRHHPERRSRRYYLPL